MKRLIIGFVTIAILPMDFKENLVKLFDDMGNDYSRVPEDIEIIVKEISSII